MKSRDLPGLSLYIHAWQGFLMILGGLLAILAALIGYLSSGGAEELLQQALVSFLDTGTARFEALRLDWRNSSIKVLGLSHDDIRDPYDRVSGLQAKECEIKVDFWPTPKVEWLKIQGMPNLALDVQEGFFQRADRKAPRGPPFPILFESINLKARLGEGPPMVLENCHGRIEAGPGGELLGQIRLEKLNGKNFPFFLAGRTGGRWEFAGSGLEIDTRDLKAGLKPKPVEQILPIELLLRGLLSGEGMARGMLPFFNVAVVPASQDHPFECSGQIDFKNFEFRLPSQTAQASLAVPQMLSWMLGGERSLWPAWLMPDSIGTGPKGRLSFQMRERVLDFDCGLGEEGAWNLLRGERRLALKALKGRIETDDLQIPRKIHLFADLDGLHGRMTMETLAQGDRAYELSLQPLLMGGLSDEGARRLWNFHAKIQDFSPCSGPSPLLSFKVDIGSADVQESFLPPGVQRVSGLFSVEGHYTRQRLLKIGRFSWEKGGIEFGAFKPASGQTQPSHGLLAALNSLRFLWGEGLSPWRIEDLALHGAAAAEYDDAHQWLCTKILNGRLQAGIFSYRQTVTDLKKAGLTFDAEWSRARENETTPNILFRLGLRKEETPATPHPPYEWMIALTGRLDERGQGWLRLSEEAVPLKLHPARDHIPQRFLKGWFEKTVHRKILIRFQDGQPEIKEE